MITLAVAAVAVGGFVSTQPVMQRSVRADTVRVETLSGSIWSQDVYLVEDLRIGALDGNEQYIFGDITEIASDGRGGLYVFDRQVPIIRHYDRDGRFLRDVGRMGEGPGEYGDAVLGMQLDRNGRLAVYDARNGRVNFYETDGEVSGQVRIAGGGGLFSDRALKLDTLGNLYLRVLVSDEWPPPRPWPVGFMSLTSDGQVIDTIGPPSIDGEPRSEPDVGDPMKLWAISPYMTVVGVNDTYSFQMREHGGGVIEVSRPTSNRSLAYWGFWIADDGRVWVDRTEPVGDPDDERTAEATFDVFRPDGVYLGEVRAPGDVRLKWIGRDMVYGVRQGELGEQYVVRLRIEGREE